LELKNSGESLHSALVEEPREWVIFPGEAPNMLLELLHANEWYGNYNCGASAWLKPQGSVKPDGQWNSLGRNDLTPSKRPKAERVGGAPDTSLEESDLPEPEGGEPHARPDKTARRRVHEKESRNVGGVERGLRQNGY
jgi:hypothetical protein